MGPQYTESVDGKHRKGFNVVSYNYSDEPCLEMVIFLYVPSDVGLRILRYESVRGGGGSSEHVTHVVYETLETVITVFYNQNSCKCLREALTI